MSRMSVCRGCGNEIIWIRTTKGKAMPCDPVPVGFTPAGGPDTFVTETGKVERGKRGGEEKGYISHFATCPMAGGFRKNER